jgi:hypothetical protein
MCLRIYRTPFAGPVQYLKSNPTDHELFYATEQCFPPIHKGRKYLPLYSCAKRAYMSTVFWKPAGVQHCTV